MLNIMKKIITHCFLNLEMIFKKTKKIYNSMLSIIIDIITSLV